MTLESGSAEHNQLMRRWFDEVWNQGRNETIDELLPAEGVGHGLGDSETDLRGPAEFKAFVANFRNSLPDVHIRLNDIFSQGDRVVVRLTLEGTHTGHGFAVPPTGRRVRIQGIVITRIQNGQIVEGWNSYDQLGLLRQLGALPALQGGDTFLSAGQG
jgi:steroid delta-isomerase-like uncharacterized protein